MTATTNEYMLPMHETQSPHAFASKLTANTSAYNYCQTDGAVTAASCTCSCTELQRTAIKAQAFFVCRCTIA